MPDVSNHTIKCMKVGTSNPQGVPSEFDRKCLSTDAFKYDLQVLGVSETHSRMNEQGEGQLEEYQAKIFDGKGFKRRDYLFFCTGPTDSSHHGVGLMIQKDLNPNFDVVSERICHASINLPKNKLHVISAYAPTLNNSEKDEKVRDDFYRQLEKAVSKIPERDNLVVVGDFNAKTGSSWNKYKSTIGKFGKGSTNSNGERLLEFASSHDLVLTNTCFKHKLCHRTTWTAPRRKNEVIDKTDGKPRRNPYRNQIDYILTRRKHMCFVEDSRSYGGTTTSSDHKMVISKLKLKWWKMRKMITKTFKTNIQSLAFKEKQQQYNNAVKEKMTKITNETKEKQEDPNENWLKLTEVLMKTAESVLGKKDRKRKYDDKEIVELSEKQKKIRLEIDKSKNYEEERILRKKKKMCIQTNEKEDNRTK